MSSRSRRAYNVDTNYGIGTIGSSIRSWQSTLSVWPAAVPTVLTVRGRYTAARTGNGRSAVPKRVECDLQLLRHRTDERVSVYLEHEWSSYAGRLCNGWSLSSGYGWCRLRSGYMFWSVTWKLNDCLPTERFTTPTRRTEETVCCWLGPITNWGFSEYSLLEYYLSNILLLEDSLISISGCKFPFPVAVFCSKLMNC